MTLFLAIDTATDRGSLAVGRPGAIAAEREIPRRRQSADLMPAIQEVLSLCGVSVRDLSGIVVADGPGSFTGLRIGFATALGIQFENSSVILHTAPSLMGAAYSARRETDGPVAALYDALRGEVFGAVYRFRHGGAECVLGPMLGTIETLRKGCPEQPAFAVGDGASLFGEEVREWIGRDPGVEPAFGPSAAALLELLDVDGAVVPVEDPESFEPDYGRLAEAQVRLERARVEQGRGEDGSK